MNWMRDAGLALLVVLVLTIVISQCPTCTSEAHAQDEKEWEEWEKKAKSVGAGEEAPPMPDEEETPHEQWCEKVKGWCPTVTNGVHAGKKWCIGKPGAKKKPKCYASHRNRSYDIYLALLDWFKKYPSGKHGIFKSGTIRTESELTWDGKTDSNTEECGLASVDKSKAKVWDINACDPEANFWTAQAMDATRLIRLREKYPQLVKAPLSDQWKLAGACGAIGSNKVWNLIDASGALRVQDDGTLFYKHPHDRVLKWMVWKDNSDPTFFYNFLAIQLLGRNPGRGAFRVARSEAQEVIFEDMLVNGLDAAYAEPMVPPRPEGLYPFPDNPKHHCQCWRWPELELKMPTPHTSDPGLNDPRKE